MTTGVIDGTEERALATSGGPETLVPGYPWQAQQLAETLSTYAATLADTAASLSRIEVTGWTGAAPTLPTRASDENRPAGPPPARPSRLPPPR